jgi:hypothetical protein
LISNACFSLFSFYRVAIATTPFGSDSENKEEFPVVVSLCFCLEQSTIALFDIKKKDKQKEQTKKKGFFVPCYACPCVLSRSDNPFFFVPIASR